MAILSVRAGEQEIRDGLVALWDNDPAQLGLPEWVEWGGAWIAGNPEQPEKVFRVVDTAAAVAAIKMGRLVVVEEVTAPSAPSPLPTEQGSEEPDTTENADPAPKRGKK